MLTHSWKAQDKKNNLFPLITELSDPLHSEPWGLNSNQRLDRHCEKKETEKGKFSPGNFLCPLLNFMHH